MKEGLVSIIIPTFNRGELLINTLESVQKQSYTNWECIIVDDGSNKDEIDVVQNYIVNEKRITFKLRPLKKDIKGPSACRNMGLALAQGEYIQFFDDDDVMYPKMLEQKILKISGSNADVVVSPLDFYDVEKERISQQNQVYSDNLLTDYISGHVAWYVSGPLWRKSSLLEEFDEEIQTLDDWDFNLRNIYNSPKILFLQMPLQRYMRYGSERTLSTSKQFNGVSQIRSIFEVHKKHYEILKNKSILSKELKMKFMDRFSVLLRETLKTRDITSRKIFVFIMRNHCIVEFNKVAELTFGYCCYRIFNKGYKFIKYGT